MCYNGSERMELLGTVVSSPVLHVAEMAVLNHKLARPNVIMYWCLAINSFMCKNDDYVDYHYIS
jgi:hypothetical protein